MQERQCKSRAAQNQFTAYLIVAIRNHKRTHLKKRARILWTEIPFEECIAAKEKPDENALSSDFPLVQGFENERLWAAVQTLNNRERHILFTRVLEKKSLSEIAEMLAVTYGAAAMSYHRTIIKLRRMLGGIKSIFWNTCIAERLFQQSLGIKSHGFVRLLRIISTRTILFRRNIIFLNINTTISFILIFIVDI